MILFIGLPRSQSLYVLQVTSDYYYEVPTWLFSQPGIYSDALHILLQSERAPEKAAIVLFFDEALFSQVRFVNLTVSHRYTEHETFVVVVRVRLYIDFRVVEHTITIELLRLIAKEPSQHVFALSANRA
jgi:hypothetical protein